MSNSPVKPEIGREARILIVQPDDRIAKRLVEGVQPLAAKVRRCADVEAAEAEAASLRPHVVILAGTLPQTKDAERLCQSLRGAPHSASAAIVVQSDAPYDEALLSRMGATAVISTSEEPASLRDRLGPLIRCALLTESAVQARAEQLAEDVWSYEQFEYLIHDLRSPLSVILANLQLVRAQSEHSAAKQLVEECHHAAERMERMIVNLLDMGHLEAGQLELDRIRVALEDLVDEAVDLVAPMAVTRDVRLVENLGSLVDEPVDVDFDLMTRLLVNLLENGIRHAPLGSTVVVSAGRDGEGVIWLTIEDEGAGVPDEWRERIFRRFVQHGSPTSNRVGRGLGLAFSKLVADAHGFEIGVEPREPRGSRFYIGLGGATSDARGP